MAMVAYFYSAGYFSQPGRSLYCDPGHYYQQFPNCNPRCFDSTFIVGNTLPLFQEKWLDGLAFLQFI